MALARFDIWVRSAVGPAAAGAMIFVVQQPVTFVPNPPRIPNATQYPRTQVQMYSDQSGQNPIAQPLIADGFGHAFGYCAPGVYTVFLGIGGMLQLGQTCPDQLIENFSTTLSLSTNGIPNTVQELLNIQGAGSVTVASDNAGNITITGSTIPTPTLPVTTPVVASQWLSSYDAVTGVFTQTQPKASDLSIGALINGISATTQAPLDASTKLATTAYADNAVATSSPTAQFMFGPGFTNLPYSVYTGVSPSPDVAGQVIVVPFTWSATLAFDKVSFTATYGGGTELVNFGLYSSAGAKLWESGPLAITGSGAQNFNVTPYILVPGSYYYAQASNNTSVPTIFGYSVSAANNTPGNNANIFGNGFIMLGQAANSAPSNVSSMPSTLGTITANTGTGNNYGWAGVIFHS